jgi:uncharacterized repeat protein (TIGR02543 family)
MKTFGTFVILAALVAGLVGCGGGDGSNGDGSYTLIIDFTAGGTVAVDGVPLPGKAILAYDAGTVVSLDAAANAGYRFAGWTGDASTVDDINAASTIVTMNDDYSIAASFEEIPPNQYRLTVLNTGGGSVMEPAEGSFTYGAGTIVNLVAIPASGYRFVNWTGDVSTVTDINAASVTVTVDAEYFIIANFRGEGSMLWCGGVVDPQGWWQYSVECDAERDIEWHEALFIRVPNRFLSDTSEEAPMYGGHSGGGPDGWARVYYMYEKTGGEERQVIVASWWDVDRLEAALFPATQENMDALVLGYLSGEFYRFLQDIIGSTDDVIHGWTVYWERKNEE